MGRRRGRRRLLDLRRDDGRVLLTYSWTAAPTPKVYNADSTEAILSEPSDVENLVNNQPYEIDRPTQTRPWSTPHDAYGNA